MWNQSPIRLLTWAHDGLSLHAVCSSIPSRGPCPLLSPWSKLIGAYAPALLTSTSTVPTFCAADARASTPFGPLKSAVTTSAPAAPFSLQLAATWVIHTSCFLHSQAVSQRPKYRLGQKQCCAGIIVLKRFALRCAKGENTDLSNGVW